MWSWRYKSSATSRRSRLSAKTFATPPKKLARTCMRHSTRASAISSSSSSASMTGLRTTRGASMKRVPRLRMRTSNMKVSVKKIKDCRVKMTVEVEPELVEDRFQAVLKDFQKAARLPGFREGKAPFEMIEKKFSKEAEEETLKNLIPEIYHRSVQEEKVSPVSLPAISDVQYTRGKKLTFV